MAVRSRTGLYVTVTALVALLAIYAYHLNIWQDEAYSLHSTSRDFRYAMFEATRFEGQAPLYYALLFAWRSLNESVFFARLLSIGCVIGAIAAVWHISKRWLTGLDPLWPSLAFAINPFTVFAALEIRLYALGLLLAALMIWTFLEGYVAATPSRKARIAYVTVAIAALYTQYYLGALLVANAAVLVALRRYASLRSYALAALAVLAGALPLAIVLPSQMAFVRGYPVSFGAVRAAVLVGESLDFVSPHRWAGSWTHASAANALYFVALIAVAALIVSTRSAWLKSAVFGTMTATLVVLFFGSIVIAHQQLLLRHMTALVVPALLWVFAVLGASHNGRNRAFVAFGLLYVAESMASVWSMYPGGVKPGDWKNVAAYIDERAGAADTIAVFNSEIELPLRYYFKLPNRIVAVPREQPFDVPFDQRLFVIHDDGEVARALRAVQPGGRVWLVTSNGSDRGDQYAKRFHLERYVAKRYREVETRQFNGTTVRELAGKPD